MTRIPEPDQTPQGPAYEGRLLVRPDDEVVDQGAGFDLSTVLTRRWVLGLVGVGAGTITLAACGSDGSASSTSTAATGTGASSATSASSRAVAGEVPEETNGPYPADGTNGVNVLEESGIVRSDITTSLGGGTAVEGVPLEFTFVLTDMANDDAAFEGAAVYTWHCDAHGRYSMYSEGVEDETFLRGIQVADANGTLTFQTVVPGCYAGRWTHIHFEVYSDVDSATDVSNVIATSQVAFPADMLGDVYALDAYAGSTRNLACVGTDFTDDGIFGDGDWELQVPTVTGGTESGYAATLAVGVDTTTTATGGGGMAEGPGAGGQAPGAKPPTSGF